MKHRTIICLAALLVLCFLRAGYAGPYYAGFRSTANLGQLVTDDGWADWGGFKLTFSAELKSDTLKYWKYTYTFSNANGSPLDPKIEKFLKLQVSDPNLTAGEWYRLESLNGSVLTPVDDAGFHLWDTPVSYPYYDLGYYIKIGGNEGPITGQLADGRVTILSSQAPMWGSFYARGGYTNTPQGPAEAVNRGFLNGVFPSPSGVMLGSVGSAPPFDPEDLDQDINGANVKYWILVPDTISVPESGSTFLFLAIALIPIAASYRWWRN
jgi:hypothetical protein